MMKKGGRNFSPLPPSGAEVFDFSLLPPYSLPTPSLLDLSLLRRRKEIS